MQRVLTYEDATFKGGRVEGYFFAMQDLVFKKKEIVID